VLEVHFSRYFSFPWIRRLEPRIEYRQGKAGIVGIRLSEADSNTDDSPSFRILPPRVDSDTLNWCGLRAYGTVLKYSGVDKSRVHLHYEARNLYVD